MTDNPRRWHRFSLRTLLIFVLLVGSAMHLWHNSASWVLKRTFANDTETSFSPDGKLIAVLAANTLQVCDAATGQLVATLDVPLESPSLNVFPGFSADGKWLAACDQLEKRAYRCVLFWRTSDWSFVQKVRGWEYDYRSHAMAMVGTIRIDPEGPVFETQDAMPDDLKVEWLGPGTYHHPYIKFDEAPGTFDAKGDYHRNENYCLKLIDVRTGASALLPGDRYAVRDGALSRDAVSLMTTGYKGTQLWRCRRPMEWWGVFWLWEFWLTTALAGALCWSVSRRN